MAPAGVALVVVCLLPLGRHDARLLAAAERGVAYLYGFEVRRLEPRPLPRSAYHAPRSRWRADKLLAFIDAEIVPGSGCQVAIGFTDEDISTTKGRFFDWGVLGLAHIDGTSAVVSSHRARRGARGDQLVKRIVNVVNHELGHALGLEHDRQPGCIMNDAEGSVRTVDRETGLLCPRSRAQAEARLRARLPPHDRFDWQAVLKPD